MATGIIIALHVISKYDLRSWVIRIASITEELSDILNILVAAIQLVLEANIVNPHQERFLRTGHGGHDLVYGVEYIPIYCQDFEV